MIINKRLVLYKLQEKKKKNETGNSDRVEVIDGDDSIGGSKVRGMGKDHYQMRNIGGFG